METTEGWDFKLSRLLKFGHGRNLEIVEFWRFGKSGCINLDIAEVLGLQNLEMQTSGDC